MLKTYLYIPEELHEKISIAARSRKMSKAEVIRKALASGIREIHEEGTASALALEKIAQIGKKYNLQGPKDGSEKMDEYLWGKDWSKNE